MNIKTYYIRIGKLQSPAALSSFLPSFMERGLMRSHWDETIAWRLVGGILNWDIFLEGSTLKCATLMTFDT